MGDPCNSLSKRHLGFDLGPRQFEQKVGIMQSM